MMVENSKAVIHQLVHGYARGHELLAQSVKLSNVDLDEALRLSDLSGLQLQETTPPHLTCYPLPSGSFFAFAKTWIDEEAQRGGCVLTQTLLIPREFWAQGSSASSIANLFSLPRRPTSALLPPLSVLGSRAASSASFISNELKQQIEDFVARFFIDGISPIVWPIGSSGQQVIEEIFFRIVDVLWPAKRASFSATTFALQPRRSADGYFKLMFIPSAAIGRFSSFSEPHFIGRGSRRSETDGGPRSRRVVDGITEILSGGTNQDWADFQALRSILPESSDALMKVATLEDLTARGRENPLAYVAALDVWAGMAPEPAVLLERKELALKTAVDSINELPAPIAIEVLSAILQRLARPPFSLLRASVGTILKKLTSIAESDVGVILDAVERQKRPAKELLIALSRGLMGASWSEMSRLENLGMTMPGLMQRLLAYNPRLPSRYLKLGSESRDQQEKRVGHLVRWLDGAATSTQQAVLQGLRDSTALLLNETLLRALVDVAVAGDINAILQLPRLAGWRLPSYVPEVLSTLATRHPQEAFAFYKEKSVNSIIDAEILTALLHTDRDLENALQLSSPQTDVRAHLVSNYILRHQYHVRSPEVAANLLVFLIDAARSGHEISEAAADVLLEQASKVSSVGLVPFASITAIMPVSLRRKLLQWSLSGIIASVNRYQMHTGELAIALENPDLNDCLRTGDYDSVSQICIDRWSELDTARVWEVFAMISGPLCMRDDLLIVEILEEIFAATHSSLDEESITHWLDILRLQCSSEVAQSLQISSLGMAYSQLTVPLNRIVVEVFPALYLNLPATRAPTMFDVFLLYALPDKRADLRRQLVDAFLNSDWPPGDLAMLAGQADILPKIYSRLKSLDASSYIRKMQKDLKSRNDAQASMISSWLEDLASSKN